MEFTVVKPGFPELLLTTRFWSISENLEHNFQREVEVLTLKLCRLGPCALIYSFSMLGKAVLAVLANTDIDNDIYVDTVNHGQTLQR